LTVDAWRVVILSQNDVKAASFREHGQALYVDDAAGGE